jgi:putative ABC transport system permease protein
LTAEDSRAVWQSPLDDIARDLRYGMRTLRRNPGFTAVAVLTLALGIGANTAIFSVVYATVLKPLPYAAPAQLFNVFQAKAADGVGGAGWSYLNFTDLREQSRVFTDLAGAQHHQLTLTGRGDPIVVNTSVVTPELFSVFGVKALAGRTFSPDDGKRGALPVVLLSEALWRGFFHADPAILGASINLEKRPFTVIGILPGAFRFPVVNEAEQVWIPLAQDPLFSPMMPSRTGHWLQVTGRVKPGVTMAQAQAELDAIGARLAGEFPAQNGGWSIRMVSLQEMLVRNVRSAMLVLLAAVGLVLLIACANIANLLLARATSRAREIAVRAALGAGRARIVRQLLSETAVLGLLGGLTGLLLAYWGVQALAMLLPSSVPQVNAIRVDYTVLAFAVLVSVLASCAFGLAPALFLARSDLQQGLRESGRTGESGSGRRARRFLAAAEIALAIVLLVTAGLLMRSFSKLTAVSPGFDARHIVKADISLPRFQYATPRQWIAFSDDLLARVQSEPGLANAAVAVPRPLADGFVNLAFDIVGVPTASSAAARMADYVSVTPGYFGVMGIPLLAGRLFDLHDNWSAPRIALISKKLARTYFPNQDPIGQSLAFGFPPDRGIVREIVGVVGDVRDVALGQDPGPMMYVPYAQAPFWGANMVVKTSLPPSAVADTLRRDVRAIDKDVPVTDVAKLPDLVDASVAEPRFRTALLTLFAAIALVLAATGIFGVISYSVSQRTREIGIRVALGASRPLILRMVARDVLGLTLTGLALGIPAALAASRLLGHLLFDTSTADPATVAAVILTIAAVAALAGYIPVRRAMQVDPMVALHHE